MVLMICPFVDPVLRGLGPDQVLVLVNNKRRHKVSFSYQLMMELVKDKLEQM
jgi:hypothetical protein